ncbi:cytochrome b5 [Drosophila ficusphila]|uniref:cytochrome b5 n=1 Tax=Drosophila ficusphila TaxID=30025 RepID=UPI0007E6CEC7|nr:cytochrome b5 [Drosophila ficusphila]
MSQLYELSEVAQNNGKNGKPCWLIIKGNVYDVTKFLSEHPGGSEALLEYAGKDATKAFKQAGHSSDAEKDLKNYKIGEINSATPIQTQPTSIGATKPVENTITEHPEPSKKSSSGFCCC